MGRDTETGGLTQQLFPHNTQTSMLGRKRDSLSTKGYEAAASTPSAPFSSCATPVTVSVTSRVMARLDIKHLWIAREVGESNRCMRACVFGRGVRGF